MKKIYVNSETLNEAVSYLNDEITFFGFLSHTKDFLKQILTNPLNADVDEYLKKQGLDRKQLLNLLLDKNIVEKETKIDDKSGKDKFAVKYNIPKRNFERKMRRLYSSLFEKNEIKESFITEDGEGGCCGVGGGATSADASGQVIGKLPGEKVQRRTIYVTNEQADLLKETDTQSAGDYEYDVAFNFNNGNDPTFNHQNMIAGGVPKKKTEK
jgi:hypothetical protein